MSYIPTLKGSKYRNVKTEIDGHVVDSKREAARYAELQLLQRGKVISDLKLQVPFEIIPAMKINGRRQCAIKYIADFTYLENGKLIVEDSKGMKTNVYTIKKRLMKQVHDIDVRET